MRLAAAIGCALLTLAACTSKQPTRKPQPTKPGAEAGDAGGLPVAERRRLISELEHPPLDGLYRFVMVYSRGEDSCELHLDAQLAKGELVTVAVTQQWPQRVVPLEIADRIGERWQISRRGQPHPRWGVQPLPILERWVEALAALPRVQAALKGKARARKREKGSELLDFGDVTVVLADGEPLRKPSGPRLSQPASRKPAPRPSKPTRRKAPPKGKPPAKPKGKPPAKPKGKPPAKPKGKPQPQPRPIERGPRQLIKIMVDGVELSVARRQGRLLLGGGDWQLAIWRDQRDGWRLASANAPVAEEGELRVALAHGRRLVEGAPPVSPGARAGRQLQAALEGKRAQPLAPIVAALRAAYGPWASGALTAALEDRARQAIAKGEVDAALQQLGAALPVAGDSPEARGSGALAAALAPAKAPAITPALEAAFRELAADPPGEATGAPMSQVEWAAALSARRPQVLALLAETEPARLRVQLAQALALSIDWSDATMPRGPGVLAESQRKPALMGHLACAAPAVYLTEEERRQVERQVLIAGKLFRARLIDQLRWDEAEAEKGRKALEAELAAELANPRFAFRKAPLDDFERRLDAAIKQGMGWRTTARLPWRDYIPLVRGWWSRIELEENPWLLARGDAVLRQLGRRDKIE